MRFQKYIAVINQNRARSKRPKYIYKEEGNSIKIEIELSV